MKPARYTESPVIRVENLVKTFDGKRNVLDGISFEIGLGETIIIMGGSGCGKSTLLRHLIRHYRPTAGKIHMFGEEIGGMTEREMDEVRKRFGIAFQYSALYNSMTVFENVALPIREHFPDLDPATVEIMVKVKLNQVGMRAFGNLKPSEISGGMQKRVAFARAAALDPEILFYDEPTAGLDPITAAVTDGLMMDFSKKLRVTSIVVTHDLHSAFKIGDRFVMLDRGKIIAEGPPEAFKTNPDPRVRQFIDGDAEGPMSENLAEETLADDLFNTKVMRP
jgi:phospholipid/cholesterol/gamma-HCH transport system ATP-binding protein